MSELNKKYELVDVDNMYHNGRKLYRVRAIRDFYNISEGDIGGFVESEENLSHSGNCWVYDNAYVVDNGKVYDDAKILDDAWIYDNAEVYGNAIVRMHASVYGHAKVYDNAHVFDRANVYQTARVCNDAEVFGNAKLRRNMIASRTISVVDNNDIVITVSDKKFHVYQSKIFEIDDYPKKYLLK